MAMAQNITLMGASYTDVPAVTLPKTGGGTATFYDDSDTQTVTENGDYDMTGIGSVTVNVPSGGASIGVATKSLSSNSTSISFDVEGEPLAFSCALDAQITLATTYYVVAVHSDGTNTYGNYVRRSSGGGSSAYCYYSASYFTWTYSNGTLTITTQSSTYGGYFRSGYTYRLIYVY